MPNSSYWDENVMGGINMGEHGMGYDDVRKRINRMNKTDKAGKVKNKQLKSNLVNSLINQAERRERGSGAEIIPFEFLEFIHRLLNGGPALGCQAYFGLAFRTSEFDARQQL